MMTHDELIAVAREWLSKPWRNAGPGGHSACSVIITDMASACQETPDAIGWHSGSSTLVECKVSLEDFKSDKGKFFRQHPYLGVGDYRYYMAPIGLIDPEKLPEGWGLIQVNDDWKTRVVKVKASERFEADKRSENCMLISLLRRLRVDPGRHVKIRAYTIDDAKEPRATVTFGALEEK